MAINSTELLQVIKAISDQAGDNIPINIVALAEQVGLTLPKLIAVLTELEQRDQIILEVETHTSSVTNELTYGGTVRMMEIPPDELTTIPGPQ